VASSISNQPPRTSDIRCIITKGVENCFLTSDTNDPDKIVPKVDVIARGLLPVPAPNHEVLHRRAVDERTH
jgi:hypothetical protein